MRSLLFVSAIAFSMLVGAVAANAQSARATRAPVPNVAGEYPSNAYPPKKSRVFPYATSPNAYYDPHFDQYPEWAQKAFTPIPR